MTKPHVVSARVFLIGGAVLAPWIVVIGASQQQNAGGFHLRLTSLGMSTFVVAALITTAVMCHRRSPTAAISSTSTATLLFISAWFNTLTSGHGPITEALVYDVVVKLPTIILCLWLARRISRDRGGHDLVPGWISAVLALAAIALVPWFLTVLSFLQRTGELHNLGYFWVGMDLFELVGMIATGLLLRQRSPLAAVTAAVTGTLLFSDAWFNVVTTVRFAHLSALCMALIEVPLAMYSFVVANREVTSWPTHRLRVLGGRQPVRQRSTNV